MAAQRSKEDVFVLKQVVFLSGKGRLFQSETYLYRPLPSRTGALGCWWVKKGLREPVAILYFTSYLARKQGM